MIATHNIVNRQNLVPVFSPNNGANEASKALINRNENLDTSKSSIDSDREKRGSKQSFQQQNYPGSFSSQMENYQKSRGLLDKMVESMGAIGTDFSTAGRFVDIYI